MTTQPKQPNKPPRKESVAAARAKRMSEFVELATVKTGDRSAFLLDQAV